MKFSVVGVIAFVIDYGLLALLTEVFGVNYLVSATISFTVSVIFNYLASMRYLCQFRRGRNSIPLQPDAQQHTIVTAAKHFMDENIERRITLKDVLQYVGYSQSHFNEIFHKQMGVSPLVYFKQQKIKHACHLLVMTDLKINQICYKLGFDDSLYFSRMFKKHTGMSPRAYRLASTQRINDNENDN